METHQHQNIEKQIDEVFASTNSSPSHEFSFTISQNFSTTFPHNKNKSKTTTPPSNNNFHAIDLSPADDIFFHGHLLPLQFLSHFNSSSSPRSSTNSMDSFTLPIKELLSQDESTSTLHSKENNNNNITLESNNKKVEVKSNVNKFVFSLFGSTKRSKECQVIRENLENQEKQKKKSKIDVLHALKKYLRMVKPLMLFRGQRGKIGINRKSYTYSSGSVTPRSNNNNKKDQFLRSWRGQYSAPASMRNSPTNSGLLIATNSSPLPPTSDSTMEELQAAIQAAIVHCKNSFAKEEKLNC